MSAEPADTAGDTPLSTFTRCHLGIVSQLQASAELPELAQAAERARAIAQATLDLFDKAVLAHHEEEEDDLFPAVLRSATPAERPAVDLMVKRLTAQHREIEALWKRLEPSVRALARGAPASLDGDAMSELVQRYLQHARDEETHFLPLAETILARNGNHMAALGMSLHIRHAAPHVIGYL